MKLSIFKNALIAVFGGLMMSQAGTALADNQSGGLTTGLAAAVDFYQVTCFDDGNGAPSYFEAQVKDITANTPKASVLIYKGTSCTTNKCAQSSTDTTDNNTTCSPLVKVTQGAGTYSLFVMHTTTGTDSYDVIFHCKTTGNVHTGTSITARQQQ